MYIAPNCPQLNKYNDDDDISQNDILFQITIIFYFIVLNRKSTFENKVGSPSSLTDMLF